VERFPKARRRFHSNEIRVHVDRVKIPWRRRRLACTFHFRLHLTRVPRGRHVIVSSKYGPVRGSGLSNIARTRSSPFGGPPSDFSYSCKINAQVDSRRISSAIEFRVALQRGSEIRSAELHAHRSRPWHMSRKRKRIGGPHEWRLRVLAMFDKPDPLTDRTSRNDLRDALAALGVRCRRKLKSACKTPSPPWIFTTVQCTRISLNESGVWPLEIAPRPIGGLCRACFALRPDVSAEWIGLEELFVAAGCRCERQIFHAKPQASGVMMIPVPRSGVMNASAASNRRAP